MSVEVQSVHHILSVGDMERAIGFYRGVLGFEVVERPAEWWCNPSCGRGGLGLNGYAPTEGRRKTGLSLMVANLDAACEAVVAGGAEVLARHEPHSGSTVRLAEIVDPEGNEILLAQHV